jgi:hypothetical protein
MRLVDLAPHWVQPSSWSEQAPRFYIGVSFLCPHCEHTKCPTCGTQRGRRLAVSFWPPIDPEGCLDRITEIPHANFHERLGGEAFETLTLKPSIRIHEHWHGSIVAGELINAPG